MTCLANHVQPLPSIPCTRISSFDIFASDETFWGRNLNEAGGAERPMLGVQLGKMDRGPYWVLSTDLEPVQLGLPPGRAKNTAGGQSSSCDLLKAGVSISGV